MFHKGGADNNIFGVMSIWKNVVRLTCESIYLQGKFGGK